MDTDSVDPINGPWRLRPAGPASYGSRFPWRRWPRQGSGPERVTTGLSMEEQRNLVPVSTVWGMHACVVGDDRRARRDHGRPLAGILGRRRVLTALALLVGGYLACGLAPQTTRIFFDEHLYCRSARRSPTPAARKAPITPAWNMASSKCTIPGSTSSPTACPTCSPGFTGLSASPTTPRIFSIRALVGLTAAALYLGLALVPWALPAGAGLAAAVLFIFTPLVPWWGHTVAVEPGAAATAAFAFLAACAHARLRDTATAQGLPASGLLLAGATAFAVYFRPESLLVFPLVAAVLWSTDDRFIEDLSAWGALALAPPWRRRTSFIFGPCARRTGARATAVALASSFIGKNFSNNGGYFVDSKWFPVAGTVLAVAGALWLLRRNRTAGLALGVWFVLSWGIFILFYAGGYYYGASSRYAVVSCAPVAVFMGIGLAGLCRRVPPHAGVAVRPRRGRNGQLGRRHALCADVEPRGGRGGGRREVRHSGRPDAAGRLTRTLT